MELVEKVFEKCVDDKNYVLRRQQQSDYFFCRRLLGRIISGPGSWGVSESAKARKQAKLVAQKENRWGKLGAEHGVGHFYIWFGG